MEATRRENSKPLGIRLSFLIQHLLHFPGDRMRNKVSSTGSSVSYWFLEWLCPFQPHVLYTIHLATGIFTEAIFCRDIIGHWHRNDRNHCHTAETFPFPLGQTLLPLIPQSSAAEYCLDLNTLFLDRGKCQRWKADAKWTPIKRKKKINQA